MNTQPQKYLEKALWSQSYKQNALGSPLCPRSGSMQVWVGVYIVLGPKFAKWTLKVVQSKFKVQPSLFA